MADTDEIQTFVQGPVFRGIRIPENFHEDEVFLAELTKLVGEKKFEVEIPQKTAWALNDPEPALWVVRPLANILAWAGDWIMVSTNISKLQEVSVLSPRQLQSMRLTQL